jgi:YesN/AraC family two-component response regulator
MQAGADDYLVKPFNARELLARVEGHIKLARVRRETEAVLRERERQIARDLASMTRLHQLSTKLLKSSDFSSLLHDVLDAAIEITQADMGNIQLLRDGELKIVAQRGFHAPFLEYFESVREGSAACGMAMKRARRVVVEDVASDFLPAARLVRRCAPKLAPFSRHR